MANPDVAQAYADTYTLSELQGIRAACLLVHQDAGEVSKSLGSGSITINRENCESILETVMEAIRIKTAGDSGADPQLQQRPRGTPLNFRRRRIE